MADLLQVTGGVIGTLVPTTTWGAPNGLFPTTDRNDNSLYSWTSSTSTAGLPASGLADGYLFCWGFETEDSSNGRYNPQARMVQASGTGTFVSASTGGYSRDSSEDRAYVSGWSFVHNPSASATFQFQWRRDTDSPNASDGTVRSFLQVIPLYYADVGVYSSTSTTATGGTTPVQITGLTGTDGTNITLASNTVSVTGDNKRYLCLGGAYHQGVGSSRTQRWYGFRIDGSKDDAAKGCMYYRNSGNADGGESFIRLIETATATRTVDLFQYRGDGVAAGQGGADVDGNVTGSNSAHALVVIELNDSAEVYSSTDSTGAQEFALTGPVDVDIASTGDIEFNDAASFTRASDIAVNAVVAMDVFAFANVSHARESGAIGSGSRWTVHGEFTVNGVEQTGVGFHGNYNRGNQSTQDCHGSSSNQAAFFALAANDDIGVSNQELAGTEGGGGDIETQPGWVGFGLINLDTLEDAGSVSVTPDETAQAQQADQTALTQAHTTTALDTLAAQTSDSPALTQAHSLTANDTSQAQTSGTTAATLPAPALPAKVVLDNPVNSAGIVLDNPRGSGGVVLSVSETGQAQASDAVSITEAAAVSPNETQQAQVSEAPGLTQAHALAANETSQAQASDAPALTQASSVTVNETAQSQVSDLPGLTESATTTPQESGQQQTSESPALTQQSSVTPQGTGQSQVSEPVQIAENANLTPTESAQAQTSDSPAATVSGSVVPDETAQAQSSDSPVVTQAHAATANDSAQNQASGQPILTQANAVTVLDSAQAQASDSPAVTQDGSVTPLETAQGHASDAPGVTQAHQLAVQDSAQAQASDAPGLTQAHQLTPNESAQAQSSDEPIVTASGAATPDETSQTQASDAATLTQAHIASVVDSSQAQSSDSPTVAENAAVTANETTQAQASDATSLTQAQQAQAQDTAQSQSSDAPGLTVQGVLAPLETHQGQTSGAPGLTQQSILGVVGSSSAQTSDQPSAAKQDPLLTLVDTGQTQASDSATIAHEYLLLPNDSQQTQGSDDSLSPLEARRSRQQQRSDTTVVAYLPSTARRSEVAPEIIDWELRQQMHNGRLHRKLGQRDRRRVRGY